ncbi:MAG: hypothetical protein M5U01_43235 [Ardenticatenaceae bacterium]|nr:hypothetical protein [Ardenticatenaceae bacterium]HBY97491.1 hypothetical protein [Chloroflexota bacterium]
MNRLRTAGLIGLGMLLAVGLLVGAGAVLAQGPVGGFTGQTGGFTGMMGGASGMMGTGSIGGMHAQMHNDAAVPAECSAMMSNPQMMGHMMQMMHGGEPMSLAECQQWMTENNIPADVQAQCLANMARYHPATTATPAP